MLVKFRLKGNSQKHSQALNCKALYSDKIEFKDCIRFGLVYIPFLKKSVRTFDEFKKTYQWDVPKTFHVAMDIRIDSSSFLF